MYIRRLCILVDSSYDTVSAPFTSPHLFSHFFLVFTASVYLYLQHLFTCTYYLQHLFTCIYNICLLVFTTSVYLYLQHLFTCTYSICLLVTASVYVYLQHLFTCIYSICLLVFTASVYLYLHEVRTVNLGTKRWSPNTDLRIILIPLRYPVVFIPIWKGLLRDQAFILKLKVSTLDILL